MTADDDQTPLVDRESDDATIINDLIHRRNEALGEAAFWKDLFEQTHRRYLDVCRRHGEDPDLEWARAMGMR